MNNKEAWENYIFYTRDVTEFSRKLAFAGIGIVWVLKPENGLFGNFGLFSLLSIVAYFVGDIAQYLCGAIRWYRWINSREERLQRENGSLEGDYSPPANLDVPVFYLFWLKVVFLVLGFMFLGLEIMAKFL